MFWNPAQGRDTIGVNAGYRYFLGLHRIAVTDMRDPGWVLGWVCRWTRAVPFVIICAQESLPSSDTVRGSAFLASGLI